MNFKSFPKLSPKSDIGGGGGYTTASIRSSAGGYTSELNNRSEEAIFNQHLISLEKWAKDNDRDARNDKIRYWILKAPAIIFAASTSALQAYGLNNAVIVLSAISAICVATDALFPGGLLHNVHRRAANEIWLLRDKVKTGWDKIIIKYNNIPSDGKNNAILDIICMIESESQRINDEITNAESGLGTIKSDKNKLS